MRSSRFLAICLAALVMASPGWSGLMAQTQDMESRVTAEVTEHMALYYRLFSERNMEALPDQVFNIPWMTFGANGINVNPSRLEAMVGWQSSLIGLLQRGWDHSEFTVEQVCVLNEGTAIVSGYNTRYAGDGSEMSVGSLVYFLAKSAEDWRIVGYTGVERGKLATC